MVIPLFKPIITEEMKKSVLEVLDSGRFVSGARVEYFEQAFAEYCQVKNAISVSSGTAAIYLALQALNIGPGDKVACPSFSFIATVSPIKLLGAEPVFIDIGDDYNMNMNDLEKKLTEGIKAVIVVHLYGQMADMSKLMRLKEKYHFSLVKDACQSHGAEYRGKKAGSFGDIACFSFYPSKNMTVAGDGGMVVTSNNELNLQVKALRNHGTRTGASGSRYLSELLGFNFRMSEIAAAIGLVQLKYLDKWIESKRKMAQEYNVLLPDEVIKPIEYPNRKHTYHLYVIRTHHRDELLSKLKEDGIEAGIHYPIPIHRQPIFKETLHLPKTDEFCQQILSLPMHPGLRLQDIKTVCEKLRQYLS
jgi:perosamine synthetase